MDSSLLHGYNNTGSNGFMCGYAASCTPAELQHREEEEELLISSQIQHHLNQISMQMNMDDEAAYMPLDMQQHPIPIVDGLLDPSHAGSFPSSSSSSSLSLRSNSLSCSPESSAHILAAPAAACGQYPEVCSSHVPLAAPVTTPYDDHHCHGQYASNNPHVAHPAGAAPELPVKACAFKRYTRHLGPRTPPPKPAGACGQRMFKTAMSVLAKVHMAETYNQQYYYQAQAQASAEAAQTPPSVNQLQHMISERKRREKLNDSFHALRAVLPPGAKKDKTSILIRAREYVRSLESKVSELEEKNKSLESRLARRDSGGGRKDAGDDDSGEKQVQIEITRTAREERAVEPREICTLKIVVRSRCNMTELVLRTLQCLKDQMGDDVSLLAMSTRGSAGGPPQANNPSPRAVLTLQITLPGANWEEQPVKDAVAKVVADAAIRGDCGGASASSVTEPPSFGEASDLKSPANLMM